MRIRIFPSPESAARTLAADIAAAVRANPSLVLALPTGQTPLASYRHLIALHRAGKVDFSRVTTFNLDEFEGIGPSDPRSYRTFLQQHLFGQINLSPRRIHYLNGSADHLNAECERYERAIARAGGIDLLILGLGRNGHVGFNEPGSFLVARTHRTKLAAATRQANRGLFGPRIADVPRAALSIGIGTILAARRIVLIATGEAKARPVERMVNGPVTPRLPASFLQLHSAVDVWLDRAAAGRLRGPR